MQFDRKLMAVSSWWAPSDLVAEAYMLRGAILDSFSHVELCVSTLAVRASYAPEYDAIAAEHKSLPSTMKGRVDFLKRITTVPGPLSAHSNRIRAGLRYWEETSQLRNLMAHGRMSVLANSPIRFEDIRVTKDGIWSNETPFYGSSLRGAALKAAKFSRICQRFMSVVDRANLLAAIEDVRALHERDGSVPEGP